MGRAGDLQVSRLELFLRVADAGSLSAAAMQMNVMPDLGRSVLGARCSVLAPMLEDFLLRHPGVRLVMHVSDAMRDLKR